MEHEFLYHRVGQQFTSKLSDPGQSTCVGRPAQFYLEPLALAHANHVAESQPLAGARDGLSLRIVNLPLQHHFDDDFAHFSKPFFRSGTTRPRSVSSPAALPATQRTRPLSLG